MSNETKSVGDIPTTPEHPMSVIDETIDAMRHWMRSNLPKVRASVPISAGYSSYNHDSSYYSDPLVNPWGSETRLVWAMTLGGVNDVKRWDISFAKSVTDHRHTPLSASPSWLRMLILYPNPHVPQDTALVQLIRLVLAKSNTFADDSTKLATQLMCEPALFTRHADDLLRDHDTARKQLIDEYGEVSPLPRIFHKRYARDGKLKG
jgi:hypothetical protein